MQPQKEAYLEYSADEITPLADVMRRKLNYYNAIMVERVCQFYEATERLRKNPSLTIVTGIDPRTGGAITMTISKVCESRLVQLQEIVSLVVTTEKILEATEKGSFENLIRDENMKVPEFSIDSRDLGEEGINVKA